VIPRHHGKSAAGTGVHAAEVIADHAGLDLGVDVRRIVQLFIFTGVDPDGLNRAGSNALAAPIAAVGEVFLLEGAGGPEDSIIQGGIARGAWWGFPFVLWLG